MPLPDTDPNAYQPCRSCGADCFLLDKQADQPCWGPVSGIEEVFVDGWYEWIHACEGHRVLPYRAMPVSE